MPPGVESLDTVFLQPLWVFARKDLDADQIAKLRGSCVEAGREGSDSRLLASPSPLRRLGKQWLELRQNLHDMRDRLEAL